jgi:hypothetical protein
MVRQRDFSIVANQNFIFAIREVGYEGSAYAIAELLDNSIQAKSNQVRVFITTEDTSQKDDGVTVAVLDNGCGMDDRTLRAALQFGGTTRFNDRTGPGRFGMGLPSSSLSQARRLEIYTWRKSGGTLYSYLDVDEIADATMREVPPPRSAKLPRWAAAYSGATGTLVVWRKCDRLEKTPTAVAGEKLRNQIGRIFRYSIWDGVEIFINGTRVVPVDPLFCHSDTPLTGAKLYAKPLTYRFRLPDNPGRSSVICVRFSELPVANWHNLPVEDKRRYGIVKGAGTSLVRAGREVSYGWHFMGKKRRENYDDWWRCEIAFGPELDEYFRPTYTKQAVHPSPELEAILTADLEAIAHTLNSRVRRAYSKVNSRPTTPAAQILSQRDKYLPQIPKKATWCPPLGQSLPSGGANRKPKYNLSILPLRDEGFYSLRRQSGTFVLVINRDHPFFDRVYAPLCGKGSRELRVSIDCLLFSLARAEAEAVSPQQRYWYNRKRMAWSNILAAYLGS